jgi:hypothetical protein
MNEETLNRIRELSGIKREEIEDILLRLEEIGRCEFPAVYSNNSSDFGFSIICRDKDVLGIVEDEVPRVVWRFNSWQQQFAVSTERRAWYMFEIKFSIKPC